MANFEELFRKTVLGLGKAYEIAQNDLFEEIDAASRSIEKISGGVARITLKKVYEDSTRVVITAHINMEKKITNFATFSLSPNGYPIGVAADAFDAKRDEFEIILDNREDIKNYLKEAASNPDSRLVLQVAFAMRQKSEDT